MWWGGNKVKRNLQIRNKVRAVKYKYKNDTNKEKKNFKNTKHTERNEKKKKKERNNHKEENA